MRKFLIVVLFVAVLPACAGQRCPTGATCARIPGPLGDTHLSGVPAYDAGWEHANDQSPRYMAAIAYDASNSQYVLFGGQTASGASDETWVFYGYGHVPPAGCQYNNCDPWGQVKPKHKPPARSGAAMAYDSKQHVVVMYGGQLGGKKGLASDTWTWGGADWTLMRDAGGPGPRQGASMVSAGERTLLFGGETTGSALADVWAWDGRTWSRVDADPTPPGRGYAAVTWDPVEQSLIVLGGTGETGNPLSDSWRWKGGAWSELVAPGPHPVTRANSLWDLNAKAVIVINGITCPDLNFDAWQWDGAKWNLLSGWGGFRWGAALAQDTNGDWLMFGGSDKPGC
ncbi:MAG TPA: kelch repeat-containing protein [Candidatus Dormibacteraeota bacterium]